MTRSAAWSYKTVSHVEIGFGQRIGLIEIDSGIAAERIFQGTEFTGIASSAAYLGAEPHGLDARCLTVSASIGRMPESCSTTTIDSSS